jgi:hypothetical protein
VPRTINRCPECGAHVSQYAAGCAICGADIQGPRRRAQARATIRDRIDLVRPAWGPSRDATDALLMGLVIAIVILVSPILGLAVAGWIAYNRDRGGDTLARNVAIGLIVLAVVMIAVPELRFGIFVRLLA